MTTHVDRRTETGDLDGRIDSSSFDSQLRLPRRVVVEQNPEVQDDNERRALVPRSRAPQTIPLWLDDRIYVRVPAFFLHKIATRTLFRCVVGAVAVLPLALASKHLSWPADYTLAFNYIELLLLGFVIDYATEELQFQHWTHSRLMNYFFCSPMLIILGLVSLLEEKFSAIPMLVTGSVIYNILLVLGISFVAAGWHGGEQEFNTTLTTGFAHILFIGICFNVATSIMYADFFEDGLGPLLLARGAAIIMVTLYICYIFFSTWTHRYLQDEEASSADDDHQGLQLQFRRLPRPAVGTILALAVVASAICGRYLVSTLFNSPGSLPIPRDFACLFLLPILNRPSDIALCVRLARAGRVDLSIHLILETSVGTVSFLNPLFILIGWISEQPIEPVDSLNHLVPLLISVFIIGNYTFTLGRSDWFKGFMCIGLYTILGLGYSVTPDRSDV